MDHTSSMEEAQRGVGFALDPLTKLAQHVISKNDMLAILRRTRGREEAQEKWEFALKSLREQARTSHLWIASLAIRLKLPLLIELGLMEGELGLEELPWTLLAYP
ncbi:hypothetical protein Tco_0908049 [Tanacetum coccineum]|uniref:Uncharacterized protein n=1 Tax=Tanacetum coccineum TaxID=301880 RepID=A0ABQ5CSI0_9ASTR